MPGADDVINYKVQMGFSHDRHDFVRGRFRLKRFNHSQTCHAIFAFELAGILVMGNYPSGRFSGQNVLIPNSQINGHHNRLIFKDNVYRLELHSSTIQLRFANRNSPLRLTDYQSRNLPRVLRIIRDRNSLIPNEAPVYQSGAELDRSWLARFWERYDTKFFGGLSLAFMLIALLCVLYEPIKSRLVNNYRPVVTRSEVTRHQQSAVSYDMNRVRPASMSQAIRARAHANQVSLAGQIMVPSVGIHLPIGRGVGNNTLMLAAGTMKPNQKMGHGNYALAGHHMISKKVLFTPLYFHAHRGTLVYVTDMRKIYTYRINVRKIINPHDVGVINNTNRPIITLITCNDSGSRRLLLQGRLIKQSLLRRAPRPLIRETGRPTNNHDVLKGY